MSEETHDNLTAAIAAHIADETGDMVGAWVVLAETPNAEELAGGPSSFFNATRHGQSAFMTTGLLFQALDVARFSSGGTDD